MALLITLKILWALTGFVFFQSPSQDEASNTAVPDQELEIISQQKVEISEPSDLCFSADGQHLYIVSDRGRLYKTDLTGKPIQRADYRGSDFEGVCRVGNRVYVVDETLRMLLEFDADDLDLKKARQYAYTAAANRFWEAVVFLPKKERFLAFTEKLPVVAHEFEDDLDEKRLHQLPEDIKEVSGATFHEEKLWVVSDEDRRIYTLKPKNLKVINSWKIPVLNPEGITVSPDGQLWVISDDMATIYKFKIPQQ